MFEGKCKCLAVLKIAAFISGPCWHVNRQLSKCSECAPVGLQRGLVASVCSTAWGIAPQQGNNSVRVLQAMEQKQLQKEAVQRLNVMIDELRNSQNADLSAKNLGEEGCIFISEGFAFNDRSAACFDTVCIVIMLSLVKD